MMVDLYLKNVSEWMKFKNIHVRGNAFHENDLLNEVRIGQMVKGVSSAEKLRACLKGLNGFFSLVITGENFLLAAVDRVRSIPLFYGVKNNRLFLSDDANYVQEQVGDTKYDSVAEAEFLLAGYVTGNDTLYPGVKQLQAGELLVSTASTNGWELNTHRYYSFSSEREIIEEKDVVLKRLDLTFQSCISRLIQWADGRPIILPLSGGYDSRIIAIMLKKLGYSNVQAFTYGRPGNKDAKVSQQVAAHLNIPWKFIPYSNQQWWDWFHSPEREQYYKMSHNFTSIPHLQDWPAVMQLKKMGAFSDDSVIIPGHTGDFVAGGHIPESFLQTSHITKEHFVREVFSNHYKLWDPGEVSQETVNDLHMKILQLTNLHDTNSPARAAGEYEQWEWQERQAKFIINSLRVYEFWGFKWWMPLWDNEMMDFWKTVTLKWRFRRNLYIEYVSGQYSKIANIPTKVALQTDRDDLVRTAKTFLENKNILKRKSKVFQVLRAWYRKYKVVKNREKDFENSKFAWFGIMDKKTFRNHHTGTQLIHSYVVKHILGRLEL